MRVSTVVLALSCLVTGYALAGTRVSAVDDPSQSARRFPPGMPVGTRVMLTFSSSSSQMRDYFSCSIAEVSAGWFRCAPDENQTDVFTKPEEVWYDLAHVTRVKKLEKDR